VCYQSHLKTNSSAFSPMMFIAGSNYRRAKVNPRHWEFYESGMKPVIAVQWVRGGSASSHIRSKLSRQVVSEPACILAKIYDLRFRLHPHILTAFFGFLD